MERNISQITNKIDNLANRGCRLLTKEEKEEFFASSKMKRYYVKGKNKGKERDLYKVDGRCFNQIWKLVYPYVLTSCAKSVYYNPFEIEDAIAEVRFNLFSILQRFGPVFHGKTLSQRLSIIVNISLTNNNNKRSKRIETVSMSNFENNDTGQVFDFEDESESIESLDFSLDIPEKLKDFIQNAMEGATFNKKVKQEVLSFTQNY